MQLLIACPRGDPISLAPHQRNAHTSVQVAQYLRLLASYSQEVSTPVTAKTASSIVAATTQSNSHSSQQLPRAPDQEPNQEASYAVEQTADALAGQHRLDVCTTSAGVAPPKSVAQAPARCVGAEAATAGADAAAARSAVTVPASHGAAVSTARPVSGETHANGPPAGVLVGTSARCCHRIHYADALLQVQEYCTLSTTLFPAFSWLDETVMELCWTPVHERILLQVCATICATVCFFPSYEPVLLPRAGFAVLRVAGCARLGRPGLQALARVGAFAALRELDVSHLDGLWAKPVRSFTCLNWACMVLEGQFEERSKGHAVRPDAGISPHIRPLSDRALHLRNMSSHFAYQHQTQAGRLLNAM